jgi:hypothetical protein
VICNVTGRQRQRKKDRSEEILRQDEEEEEEEEASEANSADDSLEKSTGGLCEQFYFLESKDSPFAMVDGFTDVVECDRTGQV